MGKQRPKKQGKSKQPAAPEPETLPLNDKQWAFVEHFLACWNGAESCRRAGYSAETARQQAYDLLTKPYIQAAIAQRLAEHKLTADGVLSMLAEHARGTLDYFLSDDGSIDFKKARRAGKMHLLKSYSQTDKGERIELHDPQAALVHIGRALKLFGDRNEDIDLSKLSTEQLERLAKGENVYSVLAASGQGGTGAPPPAAAGSDAGPEASD